MIKYIFIVGLLFPIGITAQTISGKVTNQKNEPLIGAAVFWLGSSIGTTTNSNGVFEISTTNNLANKLVATYIGHKPDTIFISKQVVVNFKLKEIKELKEVVVKGERDGIILSNLTPIKTEIITQTELRKAACCDLAGCFETQLTVQPQTTNVITNSKELRILGLSGVYNQVLIDGFPMIQGLTYTYGISGIPGTLVNNIMISKGANSVLQGYESISGQINVLTKDPSKTDKLLLNVYMNSFMEKQFNVNYQFNVRKWSSLAALHVVQPSNKVDRDKDNFLDLPLLTRYAIFNKWKYGNEQSWGLSSSISMRFMNEQRTGGQTFYNADVDKGSASIYGQSVQLNQPEISVKTAYKFNDAHKITLFTSYMHQNQQSYFGTVNYKAQQSNIYSSLQYEFNYAKSNELKVGASYRYLDLNEDVSFSNNDLVRSYAGNYRKIESIPGVFAENTMQFFHKRLTWITGIRGDEHNQFGFTVTPRTLLKYDFSENMVVRANIGTGWRTVNLLSENIGLLVSSRDIVFAEQLLPERAINYGINGIQKFSNPSGSFSGYLSMDFYRTEFQNQIFPDYDTDPTKAIIKNFTGPSVGNGFQAEINFKFWKRIDAKLGYNFLDVYKEVNGTKQLLPFNPRHKVLGTLSYAPLSKKYHLDINAHWFGEQRLPDTQMNPIEYQQPSFSKPYAMYNAQFTYNFKRFEVYAGCENILDFRQKQPIVSWQNPFGNYFDTSFVWGPTRGREVYAGIRFIIAQKEKK